MGKWIEKKEGNKRQSRSILEKERPRDRAEPWCYLLEKFSELNFSVTLVLRDGL